MVLQDPDKISCMMYRPTLDLISTCTLALLLKQSISLYISQLTSALAIVVNVDLFTGWQTFLTVTDDHVLNTGVCHCVLTAYLPTVKHKILPGSLGYQVLQKLIIC